MSTADRESLEASARSLPARGTKGAGAAIAARLAAAGATVVVTARTLPDDYPTPERFIAADIATVEGTDTVIEQIADRGGVDIIVHIAGGGASAPSGGFAELTPELWRGRWNSTCWARCASTAAWSRG